MIRRKKNIAFIFTTITLTLLFFFFFAYDPQAKQFKTNWETHLLDAAMYTIIPGIVMFYVMPWWFKKRDIQSD